MSCDMRTWAGDVQLQAQLRLAGEQVAVLVLPELLALQAQQPAQ